MILFGVLGGGAVCGLVLAWALCRAAAIGDRMARRDDE